MSLRPCALVLVGALLAPVAVYAGVLDDFDRQELDHVANLINIGRLEEAHCLLQNRGPQIAVGAPGTRYQRAVPIMKLARATGDRALSTAMSRVLREDGIALAQRAQRPTEMAGARPLAQAVACLNLAGQLDSTGYFYRGWCQHELGELAAARQDLAAALALDPGRDDARGLLGRILWRLGERRPAIELVVAGLKRAPTRADTELLANMLRYAKRRGRSERAQALASRWAGALASDDTASPLRALVAEMQLERDDLSGALETFGRVVAVDRPWLLGGVVRTARAQAARGDAGRDGVLAAIAKLPLEATAMPAPLQKLSGDIAMSRNDPARALRHYAAAVTGGEAEARELADHARAQLAGAQSAGVLGAPLAPGAMAALLSGHELAYDAHGTDDPGFTSPLEPGGVLFHGLSALDRQSPQIEQAVAHMWSDPAARRARNALAIMRNRDMPHDVKLALAADMSTPVPARRAMVERYLSGDVAGAKADLDAFSLVSWQVLKPGVVGALRIPPPGSGAANVEPVKEPASAPPALESVGQALAALNDPKATEEVRLAKIMEVAAQRTPETQRIGDPIAIDLDGNGQIDLTGAHEQAGSANFDLDGWGNARQVQWLKAGHDGWLCEAPDGQVTSGHQLFGTAGGFTDGFEKLALRDKNGDGVISGDELAGLSIWRDDANPGRVDAGELIPVAQAGLESITIPRVGLRTIAVIHGHARLCAEIWPEAVVPANQVANAPGGDLDLEGI